MMVATTLEHDSTGIVATLKEWAHEADAFEVRLDACPDLPDAVAIRRATQKPLIATCRSRGNGGGFVGEETERVRRLEACASAGFDYVDIEGELPIAVPEERLIRSIHCSDRPPIPRDLIAFGRQLGARGAQVKLAAPVTTLEDTINLLGATRFLAREGVRASFMGLDGFPRALSHLVGAPLVYGGARTNAPGQPALRSIRATLRAWGDPLPADRLFLVVGDPVGHSLSPRIHNAALRASRLDGACGALTVSTRDDLRVLLGRAAGLHLVGLSVTAPLKEAAYELVADRTPQAGRARSVNCIRFAQGGAIGHNTDGEGAATVLRRLLPARNGRPRILLVGSGGAARGLLAHVDDVEFEVAGRNPQRLQSLAQEFGVQVRPLEALRSEAHRYAAVVNASSVEEPVRLDGFQSAVFDLHYGEEATAWERHARDHGLPFAGGRDLLLEQAFPAFEFWTDLEPPRDAMRKALQAAP